MEYDIDPVGFVQNKITISDATFSNATVRISMPWGAHKTMKGSYTLFESANPMVWDDATMKLEYNPNICAVTRTEREIIVTPRAIGSVLMLR